jgi:hypothetical protein
MIKFRFSENYTVTVRIRVTQETSAKLKAIAESEGVSIGEVGRVFIDSGIEEYDKEEK